MVEEEEDRINTALALQAASRKHNLQPTKSIRIAQHWNTQFDTILYAMNARMGVDSDIREYDHQEYIFIYLYL